MVGAGVAAGLGGAWALGTGRSTDVGLPLVCEGRDVASSEAMLTAGGVAEAGSVVASEVALTRCDDCVHRACEGAGGLRGLCPRDCEGPRCGGAACLVAVLVVGARRSVGAGSAAGVGGGGGGGTEVLDWD